MKLLLAALGRLALISSTAIGIATAVNLENHKGYWEGTIKNVQTVDFNILANTLPSKLSQALIKQDSEEIQRTLNSNYGLFGIVVTNCTQTTWHCPDQKILYTTESKRSWTGYATLDRLQYHPFDLLRDPPPLRAERGYNNPRDDKWQTTGKTNSGQVIGRVYYVRGIPPRFQQDYLRWLGNPLSTSGAHKFYAMTVGLFLLGGSSVWLLFEWVLSRKRAQQREAILLRQQLNQQLSEVTQLLEKQEWLMLQLSRYEQAESEQIQQLTAHIAQLQTQVAAKHLNTENLEHRQNVLQQEIEQREQAIIALKQQIDTYTQTASAQTQSLEQLQQQLQADQTKQSNAKQRFEESQATIAELKRQLHNQAQDNQRAIAQLQTQLEEVKDREQWTSQQRLEAEQEIDNLRQQKQSLEEKLGKQPVEIEQEELIGQVTLLLASQRFKEIIGLLSKSIDDLSPTLAGLKGAALYAMGQRSQARPLLEKAWQAGERQVEIILPLARLWSTEGRPENAAESYLILLDAVPDCLTIEDRANIAIIATLGGFGDISEEQEVNYYEQCIEIAGSRITSLSNAEDILKERLKLWQRLHQLDKLLIAYADWLDWLASHEKLDALDVELNHLRTIAGSQKINRCQHFGLLEGLEPYIFLLPRLRQRLIDEYQGIAIAEIDSAVRQSRSEDAFSQDLKRALHYLSLEVATQIVEYQQQKQSEAAKLGIQVSPLPPIQEPQPDISSLRLALVGGHDATRREVIRELAVNYHVQDVVEVAPSSQTHISRSKVQGKISRCDLIAVITGYMGHDLSNIVSELKNDNALAGQVLRLPCRGKSGVVREILRSVPQKVG